MKQRLLRFYDAIPAWVLALLIFLIIAGDSAFMCLQAWRWVR